MATDQTQFAVQDFLGSVPASIHGFVSEWVSEWVGRPKTVYVISVTSTTFYNIT